MDHLRIDTSAEDGSWIPVGPVIWPNDPPGTITDRKDGDVDAIVFWCQGSKSVIARAVGGYDYDAGLERILNVDSTATLRMLAILSAGESYEMTVTTQRGVTVKVRWMHIA